jgi:hypothetical protein
MERVGKEGVITVQDGKTLNNELDVVEGMKFDRGYISPYFITDNKAQIVEFEKPLILLVEKRISNLASLIPLLESVVKSQRPLLIIAEVSNSCRNCNLFYFLYGPCIDEFRAVRLRRITHLVIRRNTLKSPLETERFTACCHCTQIALHNCTL